MRSVVVGGVVGLRGVLRALDAGTGGVLFGGWRGDGGLDAMFGV